MKSIFFAILIITGWLVSDGTDACFASDEWECLFCHQYPGLVMPEDTGKFKIISIDKERHFSSPHGKEGCRTCHVQIDKVPHTGADKIECTTRCHIKDKEKIEAMDRSLYKAHKDEKRSITALQDKSSCRVCHPLHPHTKNLKVRAILNMHTGYMLCGLCHLKKEHPENTTYDWKAPDSVNFTGEPYGKYTRTGPNAIRKIWNFIYTYFNRLSPQKTAAENTGGVEYVIARIAVFSIEKGNKILLVDTEDPGKAVEFKAQEKSLTPAEKEKELKYFHRDITEQEFSVACNGCHSSKGMLDFKRLGYDDKKTGYLKDMDVKRLETEYKTFNFPHMLN